MNKIYYFSTLVLNIQKYILWFSSEFNSNCVAFIVFLLIDINYFFFNKSNWKQLRIRLFKKEIAVMLEKMVIKVSIWRICILFNIYYIKCNLMYIWYMFGFNFNLFLYDLLIYN